MDTNPGPQAPVLASWSPCTWELPVFGCAAPKLSFDKENRDHAAAAIYCVYCESCKNARHNHHHHLRRRRRRRRRHRRRHLARLQQPPSPPPVCLAPASTSRAAPTSASDRRFTLRLRRAGRRRRRRCWHSSAHVVRVYYTSLSRMNGAPLPLSLSLSPGPGQPLRPHDVMMTSLGTRWPALRPDLACPIVP